MSQNITMRKDNDGEAAARYLVDRRYEGSRSADQVLVDLVKIHTC